MEKSDSIQSNSKNGHPYTQWMFAILANMLAMSYGLECGWISPVTKTLQSDASPTGEPLSDTSIALIASCMSMAAVAGVPLYSFISQKVGSRRGIVLLAVPQAISWAIRILYSTRATLLAARILGGMAAGGVFNVIPMYVKEISEDKVRGALGSLIVLSQNTGIFIMYLLGAYLDYYTVMYIAISLPILTGTLMMKAPDSPSYLVKLGKFKEATDSIALLRGLKTDDKAVELELDTLKEEDEKFRSLPDVSFKAILTDKAWRRGYIFIMVIFTFHGINGAYTIITYASAILVSTGVKINISPELQTLSIPFVMIISSVTLTVIVERCGRKWLLAGSFLITAISMIMLATAVLIIRAGGSLPSWLPVLAMILILSMYSIGVSPLPYIVMTEMFSYQVRAKVMGTVVTYAWFLSFSGVAMYPLVASAFGQYTAFILHGAINLLGFVFVTIFLPETKGKSDEKIRQDLMGLKKIENAST